MTVNLLFKIPTWLGSKKHRQIFNWHSHPSAPFRILGFASSAHDIEALKLNSYTILYEIIYFKAQQTQDESY